MHQKNVLPAALVAIVIALGALFGIRALIAPGAGSIAGKTTTSGMYIAGTGFAVGTEQSAKTIFNSSGQLTLSTTGTAVTRLNFGTCAIVGYAATIAATSTATVDCSTNGTPSGTLTGIVANDLVDAWATTTISSTYMGVTVLASTASSTPGIITLKLANNTGGTFTWTGGASSTIGYYTLK